MSWARTWSLERSGDRGRPARRRKGPNPERREVWSLSDALPQAGQSQYPPPHHLLKAPCFPPSLKLEKTHFLPPGTRV